jgi:hypothetical protein
MCSLKQLVLLCLLSGNTAVQAQTAPDTWLIRGFGTLSATRTDDSGTGYVSYPPKHQLGHYHEWSVANDSLMGVQLDVRPDQQFSATAQVIARHRARDHIKPQLDGVSSNTATMTTGLFKLDAC